MNAPQENRRGIVDRALAVVERVGNALPHPSTLFAILAVFIVLLSWVFWRMNVQALHPVTGEMIVADNLLSAEGLHRMLQEMIRNFVNFAPLGTVLVAMLGLGVAEHTGFIGTGLRKLVLAAPKRLLTFVIVLAGILSNLAVDAGYVLLIPLGAIIFLAVGRHPVAGIAAAFAGVSGGFSANLLLGPFDALLAGISQEGAQIWDPTYEVNIAGNYWFMIVSTVFIAAAGTWVTEKIVIPRLGPYRGSAQAEELKDLTPEEKRGLRWAFWATVIFVGIILIGLVPENGILRNPETGEILRSPFMGGIVAIIFLGAAFVGIAYGIGAGTVKNDSDVIKGMDKSMEALGTYIVLAFFMAQFVSYFSWTNIGVISAIRGSEVLQASGLGPVPLMIAFILFSALLNILIGSASAKWAIMAPVFVPMFMAIGYSPELIQAAYRVGDSVTNIISPMMAYFALILAFVERYDEEAGIGTVVAVMLPYSVVFLIGWTLIVSLWLLTGVEMGPGAPLFLPDAGVPSAAP
jgi:aminobenzoyl-glutamate transport protein